jgi:putative phosphoribosyl transferase
VTPGEGLYLRGREDLSDAELARAVEEARRDAVALDAALHAGGRRVEVAGRTLLVVDDGVATGGTLIAALRWARGAGAARVVAAVPVGAPESLARLRGEADDVVCVYAPSPFGAVGAWYGSFEQLHDRDVVRLLRAAVSR